MSNKTDIDFGAEKKKKSKRAAINHAATIKPAERKLEMKETGTQLEGRQAGK